MLIREREAKCDNGTLARFKNYYTYAQCFIWQRVIKYIFRMAFIILLIVYGNLCHINRCFKNKRQRWLAKIAEKGRGRGRGGGGARQSYKLNSYCHRISNNIGRGFTTNEHNTGTETSTHIQWLIDQEEVNYLCFRNIFRFNFFFYLFIKEYDRKLFKKKLKD